MTTRKSNPSGMNPTPTPTSMVKKKTKKTRKPARRIRTKTRKPKYLSLRLQISSGKFQQSSDVFCSAVTTTSSNKKHEQLNLFPSHQENLVEEKDTHDQNMAYMFSAADGGATTLTGLLGAASRSSSEDENKDHQSTEMSPSASLTYAYKGQEREEVALVRTALRNKERDSSEEIYVRYSEVVERRDEEVTSCARAADEGCRIRNHEMSKLQRLSLKLDYEEILNAWSDKGPLYLYTGSPQTVPDIHHDDFLSREMCNGLWSVPEVIMSSSKGSGDEIRVKEDTNMDEWKVGMRQREARVLRYKEKRQNRLLSNSKRIRYEVRKLNAEKRPRLKGRFVKNN